jgi:hypothetical protein
MHIVSFLYSLTFAVSTAENNVVQLFEVRIKDLFGCGSAARPNAMICRSQVGLL